MVVHIGLFFSILKLFTGYKLAVVTNYHNSGMSKYSLLPGIVLWFCIVYFLYYKWHGPQIIDRFEHKKALTLGNILLLMLIVILPMIALAYTTNKAIELHGY